MDIHAVITIAKRELTVSIRNRWTTVFTFVFALLVAAISYFGTMTSGEASFQGFGRTSASLLSLVLYLIPLVALMMGTQSFLSVEGDSEMLFSQPVSRTDIALGKLVGLFAAIGTASLAGFGAGGLIIGLRTDTDDLSSYAFFVCLSMLLSIVFLSISALVSIANRRQTRAFGAALAIWFFFVIFFDLLVLGGSLMLREKQANYFIFASLFANPVGMVRVAGVIALNGPEAFGAAGAALLKFTGGIAYGSIALAIGLLVWITIPFLGSITLLKRQDV
jgi:Cu-processing system permease protein